MTSSTKIMTLVSIGQHPLSARPRRADMDARALELGLRLAGPHLQVVHAGNPQEPALRSYLGMGLDALTVLEHPARADALPALAAYLKATSPQLVLTGRQAETGEGSGLLPFFLAESLGWPLLAGVADIEQIEDGRARVLQSLPRGQRRRLEVSLPCIASVDSAAPPARQSAFGPARRGQITIHPVAADEDTLWAASQRHPARPRPKRLKIITAKTGAERMRAATAKASGSSGNILTHPSPSDAAQAIFELLQEEGVLR